MGKSLVSCFFLRHSVELCSTACHITYLVTDLNAEQTWASEVHVEQSDLLRQQTVVL